MKNKSFIFAIITFCILSSFGLTKLDSYAVDLSPVAAAQKIRGEVPTSEATTEKTKAEQNAEPEKNGQMSIPEKNLNQLQNIGKDTPENKFLKFIIAMIGVAISALAIYGGLKLYKKIMESKGIYVSNPNDERSLESPKDFKTAINLFLNKTDF